MKNVLRWLLCVVPMSAIAFAGCGGEKVAPATGPAPVMSDPSSFMGAAKFEGDPTTKKRDDATTDGGDPATATQRAAK